MAAESWAKAKTAAMMSSGATSVNGAWPSALNVVSTCPSVERLAFDSSSIVMLLIVCLLHHTPGKGSEGSKHSSSEISQSVVSHKIHT